MRGLSVINKKNKLQERGVAMILILFSPRKHKDNLNKPVRQQTAAAIFYLIEPEME